MDARKYLQDQIDGHVTALRDTAERLPGAFADCLDACASGIRAGGKILFFGNGGSAADAQHLAAELTIRFTKDRPAIAAISLSTDVSALTACANDFGFDRLFARQIEALGRPGDVAFAISTSGNSPNILHGLRTARAMGLVTIGLSGRDGGDMPGLCDRIMIVPATVTARIQEMHILLGHSLCGALEIELGLV